MLKRIALQQELIPMRELIDYKGRRSDVKDINKWTTDWIDSILGELKNNKYPTEEFIPGLITNPDQF